MQIAELEQPKKLLVADPAELAKQLSGYKSPMEDKVPVPGTAQAFQPPPIDPSKPIDGRYYYTRGKKKGQPKPPDKIRMHIEPNPAPADISGELITGALLITLIDVFIPMLIVLINNWISKEKMKYDLLSLDEKQKSLLSPLADKVVAQLRISGNPSLLLLFAILGLYGIKFITIKQLKV